MKLIGDLRDKVEAAETTEEKKDIIAQAGMELTDDELENVAGGVDSYQQKMREIRDKEREKSRKQFQQRHEADKERNKQMQQMQRWLR